MSEEEKAVLEGDEVIEAVEELEAEPEVEPEQDDEEKAVIDQEETEEGESDDDEDEVIVSIGEEAPPPEDHKQAPEWVRELRKQHRELQRKNRELEGQLKEKTQTETKPVALGKKPTLEEHDYDTDKFEVALTDWYERKKQTDAEQEKARQAEEEQKRSWQDRLDSYGKAKAELKVRDFEDAEATVSDVLNVTQQGIVLQGADNPALVIYALGKNQKKADELAKINDPVKFAFAVAKLEKDLKVTSRKSVPPPDRQVQGTGPVSGAVDSTLDRLRAEAEKTGDYTKVIQYKKRKREAK